MVIIFLAHSSLLRCATFGEFANLPPTPVGTTNESELNKEQNKCNQEMHCRPGNSHTDSLRTRLLSVGAGLQSRVHLFHIAHPDDLDVRPSRDDLQPVLGLAASERKDPGAKPDEEFGDQHAGSASHDEVAELMQENHDDDGCNHHQHRQSLSHSEQHYNGD